MMIEAEPSAPIDPPPFCCNLNYLLLPGAFSKKVFLKVHPFPYKFDCVKIKKWLAKAKKLLVAFKDIGAIIRDAGHTNPDQVQHIQALVSAAGLPLPPPFFFFPATSS